MNGVIGSIVDNTVNSLCWLIAKLSVVTPFDVKDNLRSLKDPNHELENFVADVQVKVCIRSKQINDRKFDKYHLKN